ncbi:MAG: hypothetical protein VX028_00120 [Nanoarchaeota archaeon]|nr:hypothetical protein [Nanoarchaeota archaeon]MEC8339673.1 hypothetical protein [Nanoarchaeota archaeon]
MLKRSNLSLLISSALSNATINEEFYLSKNKFHNTISREFSYILAAYKEGFVVDTYKGEVFDGVHCVKGIQTIVFPYKSKPMYGRELKTFISQL